MLQISLKIAAVATLLLSTGLSPVAPAYAAQIRASNPDLYVVMFRADWCAPCKVVEPKITQALQQLNDSQIEYITIDISNPSLSELGAHRAFDRNIVNQYNRWLGVTGFAAIIDGDTKSTLGCLNMLYDVPSMTTHIRNMKGLAVNNQASFDLTCPEANNPV